MKSEKIFWGLFFILSGVFLVVSKLGYFADVNVFSLLISVFLVTIILKSLIRLSFTGIFFPIAFLCIIYDKQLNITELTPWTVLAAALLGSIGFSMLFKKRSKKWWDFTRDWHKEDFKTIDVENEAQIHHNTSFGSSIKYINSSDFVSADFNCSFGAMKVFFDNTIMEGERATVRIHASFSGLELYIPRTWRVDDQTDVTFGGIEEKNKPSGEFTNTLTIVGNVSFSGVEIVYV